MITGRLLVYTDPLYLPITVLEFALACLFLRPLAFRTRPVFLLVGETLAAFALWYGVHLLHLDFAYDFTLNVSVLFCYVLASRRAGGWQSLYVSCIFVLCTEVGKIVCVDLCMQAIPGLTTAASFTVTVVWAALSLSFALVCQLLVSRWVFGGSIERLSWHQAVFVLLPLAPYVYIRNSRYLYDVTDYGLYRDMVWVSLLLSVTTIVVVVANAHNLSSQVEKNELMRMQSLLREQHLQYIAQKEAAGAMRRRYHDLKHYLNELEALQSALDGASSGGAGRREEIGRFAARLKDELAPIEESIETGNETLDVVLTEKRGVCLGKGIRPVFYADARCLGFMGSFDLCAIFGNLLDNAIEATEKVPADEQREILLDIRPSKGLAVVRCRNPYRGRLVSDGSGFATTKADRDEHGYGLKSIAQTVERYGGSMDAGADGGEFAVTIVVPMPADGS